MVGPSSVSGKAIQSSVAAAPPDRAKAIFGKRSVSAIVMTTRQAVRAKMSRAAALNVDDEGIAIWYRDGCAEVPAAADPTHVVIRQAHPIRLLH
jgi:hypothetical protein